MLESKQLPSQMKEFNRIFLKDVQSTSLAKYRLGKNDCLPIRNTTQILLYSFIDTISVRKFEITRRKHITYYQIMG